MRYFLAVLLALLLVLPAYSFNKVVSLSPAITEIIYYVGADSKLVGDTVFCDYPDDAKKKVKVGGIVNPNVEKIYSLHPDLVIASNLTPKATLKKLETLGIKVIVLRLISLKDIENAIEVIGNTLSNNGEVKKKEFIKSLEKKAKTLSTCLNGKNLIILISFQPIYVAGSKSFIGEIFSLSKAKVVPDISFGVVSNEFIVMNKPDLALLSFKGNKLKLAEKFLRKFSIKSIFVTPDNLLHPSPRILKSLEEVEENICRK